MSTELYRLHMHYKKHAFVTIAKGPAQTTGLGQLIITDVKLCSCGRMAVEYSNSGKLLTEPGCGWRNVAYEPQTGNMVYEQPAVRAAAKRWAAMLEEMRRDHSAA